MTRLERTRKAIEIRRLLKAYPWLTPDEAQGLLAGLEDPGTHFSSHQIPYEESVAQYGVPDPAPGNTSATGGVLSNTSVGQLNLNSIASSAEVRLLNDPVRPFSFMNLTLVQKVTSNLVVRCQTPLWLAATQSAPATLTQNGQYITFTAANHTISLQSVPATKSSYTGTQSTFVNTTGFRWMWIGSDGPTVT